MKHINNLIYADEGKMLKTPNGYTNVTTVGTHTIVKDGEVLTSTINLEDIEEFSVIWINSEPYYVKSTEYGDLVTELIRSKYSLDQELALYANSRIEPNSSKEVEFQNWRSLCKKAAKRFLNE